MRNSTKKTGKEIATTSENAKEKHARIFLHEKIKTKQQTSLTMQLEVIYEKILTKEGRLKRYRDSVKHTNQNRTF